MLPISVADRSTGNSLIKDRDLVIVYESHKCMKAITVVKNGEFQNRYGLFMHDDWIGRPFGCKVASKKGGFVHLLAPNPQLWTLALTHRTQILYVADISFVLAYLEVRPGCVVLESGTGSGSLTTALARAAAPSGHIYTFDFHEQRADAARKDFERNGLSSLVTVGVRDIQGEGFPLEFAGEVDAIFLDLPQPWTAVPSAVKLLRGDAPLCSFSPCIEQVQKTSQALTRTEFRDLRTFEVLLRTYEVHEEFFGTSFGSGGALISPFNSPPHKRICPGEDKGTDVMVEKSSIKTSTTVSVECSEGTDLSSEAQKTSAPVLSVKESFVKGRLKKVRSRGEECLAYKSSIVACPEAETKGHTGYLTFARRTV
ncbi:unnamed protein product [Calypogeia fissa]